MSKLEKKFKKYVKTNYLMISPLWITKLLIKDLAEIAEKENTELKKKSEKDENDIMRLDSIIIELKKQLVVTKEKIIEEIILKYEKCDLVLINGKKLVLRKREILGDDNENK